MLPPQFRFWLFDKMSVKTMRYVSAIPDRHAAGLTKEVYHMIREDFFRNGSLTSRSKVPELMAAIWIAGRESMLVEDKVDRTSKDAICAVLSQINDCPYCEDMLVSLVHASGEHEAAEDIFGRNGLDSTDLKLRDRLEWVRAISTPGADYVPPSPFSRAQMPEILGTLLAMSDINRFSHVVMEDSPVSAPLGVQAGKALQLRLFGSELVPTRRLPLEPGRALSLLPQADLPEDLAWAEPNPRIADALGRYAASVEREAALVISSQVRQAVAQSLATWQGEQMPISRSWVESDLVGLDGEDLNIARLAILLAKAPYQVDGTLAEAVLGPERDEARFVRILAWASFTGSRRFVNLIARQSTQENSQRIAKLPVATKQYAPELAN